MEICDRGNVKESNFSQAQKAGLEDITKLKKEKHIVTKTDKSDQLYLLTEDGYIQIGEPHVEGDSVKTGEKIKKNMDILNCHAQQIC